ncbi:hypothetical protein CDIK_2114 [Cucumispora dikerogammari]|nr:hypothetical protein CDIK_2114 [Cucumispora dikerogammari]
MKKFNIRRPNRITNIIPKKILEEIEMNISMRRLCSISQSSQFIYLVERNFIVDIDIKTCSCKQTWEVGYPCKHLSEVIIHKEQYLISFIKNYFTPVTYFNSYQNFIYPLTNLELIRDTMLPSIIRRTSGRPRISLIISCNEN